MKTWPPVQAGGLVFVTADKHVAFVFELWGKEAPVRVINVLYRQHQVEALITGV